DGVALPRTHVVRHGDPGRPHLPRRLVPQDQADDQLVERALVAGHVGVAGDEDVLPRVVGHWRTLRDARNDRPALRAEYRTVLMVRSLRSLTGTAPPVGRPCPTPVCSPGVRA